MRRAFGLAVLVPALLVLAACSRSNGDDDDGRVIPPPPPDLNPPPAPLNLTATPGDGQVRLEWAAVADATGYNVKSATVSGGPYGTVYAGIGSTFAVDDNLTNGVTYFYVVSAVNAAGQGPDSVEVSAVPQDDGAGPGNLFQRHPANPVLAPSPGSWDANGVFSPSVLRDGDKWLMYYTGDDGTHRIGRAESPDGIIWVKDGAPLFDGAHPTVVLSAGFYRMWFMGPEEKLFLATSNDGIAWNVAAAPVFEGGPEGSWDRLLLSATVLLDGAEFRMWYAARQGTGHQSVRQIGYATSPDGVTWTRFPHPVLSPPAQTGDFPPGVTHPTVLIDDSGFRMWYDNFLNGDSDSIGTATSTDGINWVKPSEPALLVGPAGEWDEGAVEACVVVRDGETLRMWYTGRGASPPAIGLATNP